MQTIDQLRVDARHIFQSGIKAADPYLAVKRCLHSAENQLYISLNMENTASQRSAPWQKIYLIAFGKAACTMAKAAQEIIPEHLLAKPGLAVCNYENVDTIDAIEVIGASHPLPDQSGFSGAQRIAALAQNAQAGELLLVLVSGGGVCVDTLSG